jgi:hypothetical protein
MRPSTGRSTGENDDFDANGRTLTEIDDVLVGQTDASGGYVHGSFVPRMR